MAVAQWGKLPQKLMSNPAYWLMHNIPEETMQISILYWLELTIV